MRQNPAMDPAAPLPLLGGLSPAQFMRKLDKPGDAFFDRTAVHYAALGAEYRQEYRALALSRAAE